MTRAFIPPPPGDPQARLEMMLGALDIFQDSLPGVARQIEDRLCSLVGLEGPLTAAGVEYPPAGAAPELLIWFEPSDGLEALMLAVRAAERAHHEILRIAAHLLASTPHHVLQTNLYGYVPGTDDSIMSRRAAGDAAS